jgi:hypothetical protein
MSGEHEGIVVLRVYAEALQNIAYAMRAALAAYGVVTLAFPFCFFCFLLPCCPAI